MITKKIAKRIKPLKGFKTLAKEANFWDTHDVSGIFKDSKVSLSKLPKLEKEKEAMLTIRIQKSVKSKIEHIAKSKGINPATLSRMWLIEKLQQVI